MNRNDHSLPTYKYCKSAIDDANGTSYYPVGMSTHWNTGDYVVLRKCAMFHEHTTRLNDRESISVVVGLKSLNSAPGHVHLGAIVVLKKRDNKVITETVSESSATGLKGISPIIHIATKSKWIDYLTKKGREELPQDEHDVLRVLAGVTNTIHEAGLNLVDAFGTSVWLGILGSLKVSSDNFIHACMKNPVKPLDRNVLYASMHEENPIPGIGLHRFLKKWAPASPVELADTFMATHDGFWPQGAGPVTSEFDPLVKVFPLERLNLKLVLDKHADFLQRVLATREMNGFFEDGMFFEINPTVDRNHIRVGASIVGPDYMDSTGFMESLSRQKSDFSSITWIEPPWDYSTEFLCLSLLVECSVCVDDVRLILGSAREDG